MSGEHQPMRPPLVIKHEVEGVNVERREGEEVWKFSSGISFAQNPHADSNEICEDFGRSEGTVMVVGDGMGGLPGGEVASRLGVLGAEAALDNSPGKEKPPMLLSGSEAEHRMRDAINRAKQTLVDFIGNHAEYQGMGTTLTAVQFFKDTEDKKLKMVVGKLGDSPLYRWRAGKLEELADASVTGKLKHEFGLSLDDEDNQSMIEANKIEALLQTADKRYSEVQRRSPESEDAAKAEKQYQFLHWVLHSLLKRQNATVGEIRHVVYSALSELDSEPQVAIEEVVAGDMYIATTDGLSVTRSQLEQELQVAIAKGSTAPEVSEWLVQWGIQQMYNPANPLQRSDDILVAVKIVQEEIPSGAYAEIPME